MSEGAHRGMIDPVQRASIRDCLDRDVVSELILAFWQDLPAQLATVVKVLEGDGQHDAADRILHTLKGSGGSLGYVGIADAAEGVRKALRTGAPMSSAWSL